MAKKSLESSDLYINRELSWLEFNQLVLQEGLREELPLLERLKFLAIVGSNLDEFFLVRVAGLMQQRSAGVTGRDPAGLTPEEQLDVIAERTHRMVAEQAKGIRDVTAKLAEHGLRVFEPSDLSPEQQEFLRGHFAKEVLPVLTPLAIERLDPCPLLASLRLHVAAVIETPHDEQDEHRGRDLGIRGFGDLGGGRPEIPKSPIPKSPVSQDDRPREEIVVVPVPAQCARFVTMPTESELHLAKLEDVIADNLPAVFPGCKVLAAAAFRITRDADVAVTDDEAGDLLQAVEEAVLQRRRRAAVRLELAARADPRLKDRLAKRLELNEADVYEIDGMLDTAALWEIVGRPGFDELKIVDWPPLPPRDLIGNEDLWDAVEDHDVLLFHPYESFDPIVKLLELAADDPGVLAVKQTLYRTSGDSPIVSALQRAAENGKEVTVLVELKARFDEARNVLWARALEDAGCHVIYGIAGLKTHAKALLIVRRDSGRIRRYVHLATGNYNDRTARLYSDVGLLTCDADVAGDVAAFFNLLTGYSETVGWSKLSIAPTGLRQRFIDLIDREVQAATPDEPGLIVAKVNSLEDPEVIRALYRAAQAGVKVKLNVRGICCLRPGIKGVSKKIEVRSIVDRYLEHARVFYFRNGGHEEVYLSSADWMQRNLSRRLEILFPVTDANLRRRLIDDLETFFADNVQAYELQSDGEYVPVERKGKRVRAQERFYKAAVGAVRTAEQTATQFRPLTRPKE